MKTHRDYWKTRSDKHDDDNNRQCNFKETQKHLCYGRFDTLVVCELHTCPEGAVEIFFPLIRGLQDFEGYISVGLQLWNVGLTCNIRPCAEARVESSGGALLKQLHRWVCNSEMEREVCIIGHPSSSSRIQDISGWSKAAGTCWYRLSSYLLLQANIQAVSRDWATLSSGLFADLRSLASGVQSFLSMRPFPSYVEVLNKNAEHPRCNKITLWDVKNVGHCFAFVRISELWLRWEIQWDRLMRFDLSTIRLCREDLHGPCAGWRSAKEGKVEESSSAIRSTIQKVAIWHDDEGFSFSQIGACRCY